MFVTDKYAGLPAAHPIARHEVVRQTCEKIASTLPQSPIAGVWQKITTGFRNWQKRRLDRQAFQHMVTLDDPILKDIGVTRADVIWASKLPLSQNAAQELENIARQNKRVY
jgi:uncharacterized protein YjiS (DUF1127 family)